MSYSGLKKKCILRLAKAKLKMEKKMPLPILPTSLCCSASKGEKGMYFPPNMNFTFKAQYTSIFTFFSNIKKVYKIFIISI